jgi:hypothetical protein
LRLLFTFGFNGALTVAGKLISMSLSNAFGVIGSTISSTNGLGLGLDLATATSLVFLVLADSVFSFPPNRIFNFCCDVIAATNVGVTRGVVFEEGTVIVSVG